MTASASLRKGWCPGALRPMQSGDGLLLRVKPRGGRLSVPALGVIAQTARNFGSGEIEITNRANVQLRGLSGESHASALPLLADAGLVDTSGGFEAVRNIVVDPLSGLAPDRIDLGPLVQNFEEALARTFDLWQLPAKFGFNFSATGDPRVGGRLADIMIATRGPDQFAIFVDGADVAAIASRDEVNAAVIRIASVFLQKRTSDLAINRMRDAVARLGENSIFKSSGLEASSVATIDGPTASPTVGMFTHDGRLFGAGVGLPFGRIRAAELTALAQCLAEAGVREVRVSPQRALVFAVSDDARARQILTVAYDLGLITQADDRRLRMDVCPGAPACANGTTDTRRDAQRLVDLAPSVWEQLASVHVSGCSKGCARRESAVLTLVGHEGVYDVVRDGLADDGGVQKFIAPEQLSGAVAVLFGESSR